MTRLKHRWRELLLDALWIAVGSTILSTGLIRYGHGDHRWPEVIPFVLGLGSGVVIALRGGRPTRPDGPRPQSDAASSGALLASLAVGAGPLLYLLLGFNAAGLCMIGTLFLIAGAIGGMRAIAGAPPLAN